MNLRYSDRNSHTNSMGSEPFTSQKKDIKYRNNDGKKGRNCREEEVKKRRELMEYETLLENGDRVCRIKSVG